MALQCALVLAAATVARAGSIAASKHNLSAAGPGSVRAESESEICVFCHTPHKASAEAPLWNRQSPGAVYVPYASSTAKATIGQPTGASKLCLSCHDGTVALGMVRSRNEAIQFGGGVVNMPPGRRANLGTDLSDDHPVSFRYDSALAVRRGELRDPATLTREVRLDRNGELQCTACHNPHDDQYGAFLVANNHASALCLACHDVSLWAGSAHRTSTSTWNGQTPAPWPDSRETTVAGNACGNCHVPHQAGSRERLLRRTGEEDTCLACHNGHVAKSDIEAESAKLSAHPIRATAGVHDPTEHAIDTARHVECADCHNAHAAGPDGAPGVAGALAGVRGVDASGAVVPRIAREYELCFRCHADSPGRGRARVNRQTPQTNTRLEFAPASASFHPVETAGRNPSVPSLLEPYTTASLIACTDCHNSDAGPRAGGAGPAGPHGSVHTPILERQMTLVDRRPESAAAYALCYKCHSRDSILADQSFAYHATHIVNVQAACTTCHDPHGAERSARLINFNVDYVQRSPTTGTLEYNALGERSGSCALLCHGFDHAPLGYGAKRNVARR
jgi:predicted CXXCH cytochrome family protein